MQNSRRTDADRMSALLPAYSGFVKAMGWVLVGVGLFLSIIVSVNFVISKQLFWPFLVVGGGFAITGFAVTRLVVRYYRLAVLLLCGIQVTLVDFASLFLYGMNKSVVIGVMAWGIVLSGLLLGRKAAAVLTGWATLLVIFSFFLELSNVVPPPVFSGDNIDRIQYNITNMINIISIIVVFYPLVVLFTRAIDNALQQMNNRAEQQEKLNLRLSSIQQQEHLISQKVNALSSELAATAEHQAEDANRQANEARELSHSLTELNLASEQITSAAARVATAASQSRNNADLGQQATGEAIEAMKVMRQQVEIIAGQISNLNQYINSISDVLKLMTDVADETHLLSLNATIEAAGAGKEGRRFNVIAREVQGLAERTRGGVDEVQLLIKGISSAAKEAVSGIQVGMRQALQAAELATRAGQSHADILSAVEQTAELAQTISATTQQQRIASKQAVASVEQFSHAAMQAAQASSALLGVVRQLSEMSQQLAEAEAISNENNQDGPTIDQSHSAPPTTRLVTQN